MSIDQCNGNIDNSEGNSRINNRMNKRIVLIINSRNICVNYQCELQDHGACQDQLETWQYLEEEEVRGPWTGIRGRVR